MDDADSSLSMASPDDALEPGRMLGGRYRLNELLDQDGQTITWRGWDETLSRPVLVHALIPGDPRTDQVLQAARSAAIATDSRFLRVLDALAHGASEPASFVVSELATGSPLRDLLITGPLSGLSSAWLVRELAAALTGMHIKGLFHGRLNPSTVIISTSGNVKIAGFLLDAALHPEPGEEQLTWSECEAKDVRALGQVLYACLVGAWPMDTPTDAETAWGLPTAPRRDGSLVRPSEVRSGVPPLLDAICMQLLEPRADSAALRTSHELATALTRVLGNADATDDLEHRARTVALGGHPGYGVAARQGHGLPESAADVAMAAQATQPMAAIPSERTDVVQTGPRSLALRPPNPDDDQPAPDASTAKAQADALGAGAALDPEPIAGASDHPDGDAEQSIRASTLPHRERPRWLVLIALIAMVLAIFMVVKSCSNSPGSSSTGSSRGGAGAAARPLVISAVTDFDPSADGGNGEENLGQLGAVTDGKADTFWRSVIYHNRAELGGLKPGVGIVIDLGKEVQLSTVTVSLERAGGTVQLRVPNDAAAAAAPMDSQKSWRLVAVAEDAAQTTTLTPTEAVRTRWALVYFTRLPTIQPARYQVGVGELAVTGTQ